MSVFSFKKIFLITIFISSISLYSQETGTVRGFVKDSTNGETLAYGNIFIKELGIGTSTDSKGYFILRSIPGNNDYILSVSYVGFNPKETKVFIAPNKITHIDIELSPSSIELQTIEKIGRKVVEENATDIGLERINIRQLEALPKGVETDIFRSLQYMPGVQSTGDVSARYYVRGGRSNENLVLLEDVPIYNPFHSFGMFSAVDPELISNIEFYKGGFTSEYAGRLSSVLKLITKDGNKNYLSGNASVSQLTAKGAIESPIPYGSFILTGRRSHSTEILKKFLDEKNAPISFYDWSAKLNYSNPNFLPTSKFTINYFSSRDEVTNENPRLEDFNWSNNLFGFKWFMAADSPLFTELSIGWSNFRGEVIPNLSSSKKRKNELTDITLKMDFSYVFKSRDELGIGMKIMDIKTKLYLENLFGSVSDIGTSGTNISLYSKYKFLRWKKFGADIGSRFNIARLSGGEGKLYFFEPRVSITYRLIPSIAFKAGWGIYQQELTTLSDESEVISLFEPWIIVPDYLAPANSIHYTGGIELNFWNTLSLSSEVYFKLSKNIPILNDQKIFTNDPDLLSGSGESSGFEFSLNFSGDPVSIITTYSLSYSYLNLNDWIYYPRYDSRHTVSLVFEYYLGNGWRTSAVWNYNSGLPFTQAYGFYSKLYIDNPYLGYFHFNSFGILADKNLGRLPDYHRLDLNLSKKFTLFFLNMNLDMSIINVYDRENLFYYKRDSGERVNMLPLLPTATLRVEI